MKSFILHGDNTTQSRKRLVEIIAEAKRLGYEINRVDWAASKKVELLTLAKSQSLLAEGTLVVIENFFTGNKKAAEILKDIIPSETSIFVFWEPKSIGVTPLRGLNGFIIQEFKIPTVIFNFLNSLAPGNAKASLRFLSESIDRDSAEFLLVMMARHIRQLIWVKEDPGTMKAADWQKNNLAKQSDKFTLAQLVNLHHKILELDRASKTSQHSENLIASLELLTAGL